ncbi:cytochrome C [Pandoraea sputorum]|nr:cytochrome C [Pandoraea sputorum]
MQDYESRVTFMNAKPRPAPRYAIRRELLVATALGVMLIAVGYAGYRAHLVSTARERIGATSAKAPATAKTTVYSRAQMSADRKASGEGQPVAARTPRDANGYYIPPSEADIPDGPYGDAIRRGRDIFTRTGLHVKDHVGNQLSCDNCHLDAGRRANAAPMWAAYGAYPAFRATTGSVSTLEDRIAACFTYSMNAPGSVSGKAPAPGSRVYPDLVTYMAWLANGAPVGERLRGAGYPRLSTAPGGYDLNRGQVIFRQNCAQCHGVDGQGSRDDQGHTAFPPLWGRGSYNWGAGMAQVNMAAAFIKANMPFGRPGSLTDQQAWDVAAYVDSHERPKDPRQNGTVTEAAKKHHAGEERFYGTTLHGHLLGTGVGGGGAVEPG